MRVTKFCIQRLEILPMNSLNYTLKQSVITSFRLKLGKDMLSWDHLKFFSFFGSISFLFLFLFWYGMIHLYWICGKPTWGLTVLMLLLRVDAVIVVKTILKCIIGYDYYAFWNVCDVNYHRCWFWFSLVSCLLIYCFNLSELNESCVYSMIWMMLFCFSFFLLASYELLNAWCHFGSLKLWASLE